MAKKEFIKLTKEAVNAIMILNYNNLAEINGFYGKEVYFTDGFSGDISYLFQCLGNLGAFARQHDLDKDISIIIISNKHIANIESSSKSFFDDIENKLNQNNSPYRRTRFLSEDHLIWYLENRIKTSNDTLTGSLLEKYKESKKQQSSGSLF